MKLENKTNEYNGKVYNKYQIKKVNEFGEGIPFGESFSGKLAGFEPKFTKMQEINGKWQKVDHINKELGDKYFNTVEMVIAPNAETIKNFPDLVLDDKFKSCTIMTVNDILFRELIKVSESEGLKFKNIRFYADEYKNQKGKRSVVIKFEILPDAVDEVEEYESEEDVANALIREMDNATKEAIEVEAVQTQDEEPTDDEIARAKKLVAAGYNISEVKEALSMAKDIGANVLALTDSRVKKIYSIAKNDTMTESLRDL